MGSIEKGKQGSDRSKISISVLWFDKAFLRKLIPCRYYNFSVRVRVYLRSCVYMCMCVIFEISLILIMVAFWVCFCTILTSDRELMDSTYMVTPTSTGGPEISHHVLSTLAQASPTEALKIVLAHFIHYFIFQSFYYIKTNFFFFRFFFDFWLTTIIAIIPFTSYCFQRIYKLPKTKQKKTIRIK